MYLTIIEYLKIFNIIVFDIRLERNYTCSECLMSRKTERMNEGRIHLALDHNKDKANLHDLMSFDMITVYCPNCDKITIQNSFSTYFIPSTCKFVNMSINTCDQYNNFYTTEIINFNPESFSNKYILNDEKNEEVKLKLLYAIRYNEKTQHYTLIRRDIFDINWVEINSLPISCKIINFDSSLKQIYFLCFEKIKC